MPSVIFAEVPTPPIIVPLPLIFTVTVCELYVDTVTLAVMVSPPADEVVNVCVLSVEALIVALLVESVVLHVYPLIWLYDESLAVRVYCVLLDKAYVVPLTSVPLGDMFDIVLSIVIYGVMSITETEVVIGSSMPSIVIESVFVADVEVMSENLLNTDSFIVIILPLMV